MLGRSQPWRHPTKSSAAGRLKHNGRCSEPVRVVLLGAVLLWGNHTHAHGCAVLRLPLHQLQHCCLCCGRHPFVLYAGERLHVLDLDNDGLISAAELSDALRFLRANLDEQDLVALLDRWGWGQPAVVLCLAQHGGAAGKVRGAWQRRGCSAAGVRLRSAAPEGMPCMGFGRRARVRKLDASAPWTHGSPIISTIPMGYAHQ